MEYFLTFEGINTILKGTLIGTAAAIGLKTKLNKKKLGTAEIGKSLGKYEGKDGIVLSKNHQLAEKYCFENIGVIAPPGEHKTTSLIITNLLNETLKGSIIISDPKGELYNISHKFQAKYRKVIKYEPLGTGIGYNVLANCKDDSEVIALAQNLLINGALTLEIQTGKQAGGVEWLQMSQGLLAAALLFVKTKSFNNIPAALKILMNTTVEELDVLFSNDQDNVKEQYNIFKSSLESPKTMSSIKVTCGSNLSIFTDKNLNVLKNDFTPEDLRKEPVALYISYPENKSAYLSPLMACVYSQIINRLIDTYVEHKSFPIYCIFDEFTNIGQLSNMVQNVTSARFRKMCFLLCFQSFTQLEQLYGTKNALSIMNGCKTLVILPSLKDIHTSEFVSKLCGETEISIKQEKKLLKTKKMLFTADEIRRLDDGKVLLVTGNRKPIIDEQNVYFKQEKYLKKVEGI